MNKLAVLFEKWQKLQPLKPQDRKRLDDKFRLEFNYNSNHIEGNTLTYGQTKLLLVFGDTTGDAKMRDYEEMKAHNVGLRWIEEIAGDKNHRLTEKDIRDLNKIILVEDYWKVNTKYGNRYQIKVGVYKTRPNSVRTVTDEEFYYASPEETPAMMYSLVEWLNREIDNGEMSPVDLAALLHYRYIRIHPFEDGNGRIARLLVTYILERSGYPMVIIKSEDKEQYLQVLHQCDVNVGLTPSDGANARLEEIGPFVEYMKRQLEWSLEMSVRAAKGESIEETNDTAKKIVVLKKNLSQKSIQKSSKAVQNVIYHTFFDIAIQLEERLSGLKEMFDSYYVTKEEPKEIRGKINLDDILNHKRPDPATFTKPERFPKVEKIKDENKYKSTDYFELARQDVYLWFNRFRYDDENTFSLNIDIWVRFEMNHYEIGTNQSETTLIRKYDLPVVEEEINFFLGKVCNDVLLYIESKTKQENERGNK